MKRTSLLVLFAAILVVFASMSTPIFANPIAPINPDAPSLNASTTLAPVADSWVTSSYPNANHGTDTTLRADSSPVVNSYLRFNVSGLSGAVSKAVLRVYANSALSSGYKVFSVANNSWSETTINYSNAPAMGTALGTAGSITAGSWVAVDVTAFVTGNGTFSFGIKNSSATSLSLASRESTNKPQLVITTATTVTATPTKAGTATPTKAATATPTKSATLIPPTATPGSGGTGTCNYTIGAGVTTLDGGSTGIKPGYRVCLAAGTRAGLKLTNFNGTASAPITLVNSGGKVVINNTSSSGGIGIQLYASHYVHITGTGALGVAYGIEVDNSANSAVDTNHGGTDHVEFDHIYASNVGAGFRTAKNNDLLDTGQAWSGTQYWIHDNWINTTTNEAMYIGTSDTHGIFPIYDVQVWNNRIDNAGYDGIQVRQAHTKVLVHNNTINGTGRRPCKNGSFDNTAGFNIAKLTDTGDWYDNTVIGARTAFYIKDSANVRVYNNLVIDSGHTTSGLTGSDCPASSTPPEGGVQIINAKNVQFMFNTVVNRTINGAYGIQINGSTGTVHDNIVGGTFSSLITGSGMTLTNNLANANLAYFAFVNPTGNNYRLTSGSPAVNKASVSSFPTIDMDNIARPQGSASDVGGYEYH